MHAILQKEISEEELRQEIGDLPELAGLLQRIYDGRSGLCSSAMRA
jgi:hypothetical protein